MGRVGVNHGPGLTEKYQAKTIAAAITEPPSSQNRICSRREPLGVSEGEHTPQRQGDAQNQGYVAHHARHDRYSGGSPVAI